MSTPHTNQSTEEREFVSAAFDKMKNVKEHNLPLCHQSKIFVNTNSQSSQMKPLVKFRADEWAMLEKL